ncbi:MAG: SDR family NAD(P)-dependent oxidoreductase, partial [Chloroflexota bacterium]
MTTTVHQLSQELRMADDEQQVAYRQGMRHVARLVQPSQPSKPSEAVPIEPSRVNITDYGLLENLQLAPLNRRKPEADEVEIEVRAAGLNFRDLLNVLGMLADYYAEELGITNAGDLLLGFECAGTVVAVGEQVTGLQVGDAVLAVAEGSLATHVTVAARNVVPKPHRLTFEEAATIPLTFLTAHYGLHHLANLKHGDRVLIHAAAGGVGQAAVQLAQRTGAEVYGTASPAKWTYLRALGVEHVLNSRTLDFADEIMTLTNGQGVDLILNSLNGDFIAKSFACLASNGRMVELGKLDIWDAERVQQVRPDADYYPFDYSEDALADPSLTPTLFAELMTAFEEGALQPLPHTVFPLAEIADALRLMQQAAYVGKLVLTIPSTNAGTEPAPLCSATVQSDGSYLITGGLGGLGLRVAQWLADQGAQKLVLSSRRGEPKETEQPMIDALTAQGVEVLTVAADVANGDDVQKLISACPQPLRGVIHAAGVLADGLLTQQSSASFAQVMAPKVAGGWHLHRLTRETDLDFFVCFSSIASIFGSPGQSNYAAANAFMDGLVHYRHMLGKPGMAINWGAWSEVGMAAEMREQDQQRLRSHGMAFLPPEQGIAALAEILEGYTSSPTSTLGEAKMAQVAVMAIDWAQWQEKHPNPMPFYTQVIQPVTPSHRTSHTNGRDNKFSDNGSHATHRFSPNTIREQLAEAQPSQQRQLLLNHIQEQVTKVLGRGPNGKTLNVQTGFHNAGMDSLTSIELRNYLQASLGCSLSATVIFNYPSIDALTNYLADEVLKLETSHTDAENDLDADSKEITIEDTIEQLSEDEAESELLAALDGLEI